MAIAANRSFSRYLSVSLENQNKVSISFITNFVASMPWRYELCNHVIVWMISKIAQHHAIGSVDLHEELVVGINDILVPLLLNLLVLCHSSVWFESKFN